MDVWAKRRLSELEAAAPVKRKNKEDTFVKVPLWWLGAVAKATRSPQQAFVGVWLLHLQWKAHSPSFPVSNVGLAKYGIDRRSKRLALANLARAGLITVEQDSGAGKAPIVTLILQRLRRLTPRSLDD